ncbi:MAG: metallophosphoesterase [Terriglobales bacterium]
MILLFAPLALAQSDRAETWSFAVSGDSRNCGDVIMPTIAASVLKQNKVAFYWHLGDFRAMTGIDEDMKQRYGSGLSLSDYRQDAWGDFLSHQVAPFDPLPVFLAIGNHETYGDRTPTEYLAQFSYWLDSPELHDQRIQDKLPDQSVKPYFHWQERGIDFISLDNSQEDGFDDMQLTWFEGVLARDLADPKVKTIVTGMHRALPNSFACAHSMNGDVGTPDQTTLRKETVSGRRAYNDLAKWQQESGKHVYVLASHSHFYMEDIYDTAYWNNPAHGGIVLQGWIVGTAGARRTSLPSTVPQAVLDEHHARTGISGYLLGTVHPDGTISFEYEEVKEKDVPQAVRASFAGEYVNGKYCGNFTTWCFEQNANYSAAPVRVPPSCNEK